MQLNKKRFWPLLFIALALGAAMTAHAQTTQICEPVLVHQTHNPRLFNYVPGETWSPDGRHLAALNVQTNEYFAQLNQTLDILDGKTLEVIAQTDTNFSNELYRLLWSPQNDRFAYIYYPPGKSVNLTGSESLELPAQIDIYGPDNWKRLASLPLRFGNHIFQQVAWSPDGKELAIVLIDRDKLASSSQSGYVVHLWNPDTNELKTPITMPLQQAHVAYFDGQWIAAIRPTDEDVVRVVRLQDGASLFEVKNAHLVDLAAQNSELLLALLPDGDLHTLQVWDIQTQKLIFETHGSDYLPLSRLLLNTNRMLLNNEAGDWGAKAIDGQPLSLDFGPSILPLVSPDQHYVAAADQLIEITGPIRIISLADGATRATIKA